MIFNHRTGQYEHNGAPIQRAARPSAGFGNFGEEACCATKSCPAPQSIYPTWEAYCDKRFTHGSDFWTKCRNWSIAPPWDPLGAAMRGLPSDTAYCGGSTAADIIGSVIGKAMPPVAGEYEPLNLYHTQLNDPARFAILSGYSNVWPDALKRGGFVYCNMFVLSPQMFIPKVGGFWLAMDDARAKGGDDFAVEQVTNALINKAPEFLGFVIDFFVGSGWGALAKKGIQLHGQNMPECDGKQLLLAVARNWGTFSDALNNPADAFSHQRIYTSLGESMVAASASHTDAISLGTSAVGYSLKVMAPVIEAAMQGNWGYIPTAVNNAVFDSVGLPPKTVLRPNAMKMLQYSERSVQAVVDAMSEIKLGNIGPRIQQAFVPIKAALDNALVALSSGILNTTTPPPGAQSPAQQQQSNPVQRSPVYPTSTSTAPAPTSKWKKAAIGAGTGLVVAGPAGAIGGAGIALMMDALKGTT